MLENMKQDEAIFVSQCRALAHKNNEILVHILPPSWSSYLFVVPYLQDKDMYFMYNRTMPSKKALIFEVSKNFLFF